MDKNEIYNKLSMYDDFTREVITNSILEFYNTFSDKYLTIDEIIKLLITNIPNGIKIYDNDDKFDAICSIDSQQFKVHRSVLEDKDYFNYVFFHEFIHSISFKQYGDSRYMGFYTIDKGDDYAFKSKAFNEAFTEYLTLKRNNKYNYSREAGSLSGYDLGATKIEDICKIVGEEELINAYFNCPYELENILNKHNIKMDELFYSIHAFEDNDYDMMSLTNRYGLRDVNNLFRLIDGSRYLFYNLMDSFGDITTEEEFNKKWEFLLSEQSSKYNFWSIDAIFRYGFLIDDAKRLNIGNDNPILSRIGQETINKYSFLSNLFRQEDLNSILEQLSKIYHEDYKKYHELLKDDFAILPYTFLNQIINNYQLYDIEIYPRVYPYLKLENAQIQAVSFSKLECPQTKTKIYIFTINGNSYVECNYDDTTINKKSNTTFEFVYGDETDIVDIVNKEYKKNDESYNCKTIY